MFRSIRMTVGVLAILLGLLLLILSIVFSIITPAAPAVPSSPSTVPTTVPQPTESTAPTTPPVIKEATASVGATGDILLHANVIKSGYDADTDTYDFNYIFQYLSEYVGALDYAVGNMEGTLAGNTDGYEYDGYPQFNAPDAIVQALKNAGFDMLLTANNHAYDTGSHGFHRTQQVIHSMGIEHIGTRPDSNTKNYILKNVNGINIAMSCYTYDTRESTDGISLNGIPVSEKDSLLVNTFHPEYLEEFYGKLEQEIAAMKAEGADTVMLFIHWGEEYVTTPNQTQKKIAQKLCDLGVDVIVGGHPHVIQPMELLTSTTDSTKTTICLYSLGNSVSNIRKSSSKPYECEDGMMFTLTFAKYSDGSVLVEKVEIVPYYVNRYSYTDAIPYRYPLVPLNLPQDRWQEEYDLTDEMFAACQSSLKRTEDIIGEGLASANETLAQQQKALEAKLGIA
ncbi:MAG: CapA family protein [Ruminococcaceae bacterium]|nr:CapA family protein [Oscillospiraceae bacterium]